MSSIAERMTSASQLATDEIRSMIHRSVLVPDQKISIDQLSEGLGVSRTPVREAVQRLELEGLVEIIPRVGVRVRTISTAEASDVYSLKAAIEPLAARWATERSQDEARAHLSPLLDEMAKAVDANDVDYYAELVERFHSALIELAKTPVLTDMWSVISARVHRLRHLNLSQPGRPATSYSHHRRMAEAIFSGHGDRAAEEMSAHMHDAHRSALRAVARSESEAAATGGGADSVARP